MPYQRMVAAAESHPEYNSMVESYKCDPWHFLWKGIFQLRNCRFWGSPTICPSSVAEIDAEMVVVVVVVMNLGMMVAMCCKAAMVSSAQNMA